MKLKVHIWTFGITFILPLLYSMVTRGQTAALWFCLYGKIALTIFNMLRLMFFCVSVSEEFNVSAGWQLEGRRLMPVLPRLMAQSSYQSMAILAATKSSDTVKTQTWTSDRYGM